MNSVIEFFKEEFTPRELIIRGCLLVLAYPVGCLLGYVLEIFG